MDKGLAMDLNAVLSPWRMMAQPDQGHEGQHSGIT